MAKHLDKHADAETACSASETEREREKEREGDRGVSEIERVSGVAETGNR